MGRDAVGLVMELRGVSFPVSLNLLAEEMGLPLPFEAEMGLGRSKVLLENLGRWPGAAVVEAEPVEERQAVGGGIANFQSMPPAAVDETIRAYCRALAESDEWLDAVAEWRGFGREFVRELAGEGRLGAVLNEAGELCVVMPCAKDEAGRWTRAQVRTAGPRKEGCEWFWPAKSEHKPAPWVAQDGRPGGLLVVAEGWGDAAAARLLLGDAKARIVATLGTGARKLEGLAAGAVLLCRQNEAGGDANARWARSIRALFPTVTVKSAFPPAGMKDWNDTLGRHGLELGRRLMEDARGVPDDEVIEGMTPEMARRKSSLYNDTLAAEIMAEVCDGRLKHDAVTGWHELQEAGHWEPVPVKRAMWWAARMAEQAKREAEEIRLKMSKGGCRKAESKGVDAAENMVRFAHLYGCARNQKAVLELASARDDMTAKFEPWKTDKMLLPVLNGMLDLRREATMLWRPFKPGDLVTWRAGVEFDETARCPVWEKFVLGLCNHDRELVAFLQRWCGYLLTGCVHEHALLYLYGTGRNGKTTFTEIMLKLMGDFSRVVPQSMVVVDKLGMGVPDLEMARLKGARLIRPPEIKTGARLDDATIKMLTGGDRLRGREHYQASAEFQATHKLLFFSNRKPDVHDGSDGLWERMQMLHAKLSFKGADGISNLDDLLQAEMSGILNWCIVGCWDWQKRSMRDGRVFGQKGLNPPQCVLDEVAEYRDTADALGGFIHDRLTEVPGLVVTLAEVRKRLKAWCEDNGEDWLAGMSTRKIRKEFESRGWVVKVDRNKQPYICAMWRGESDADTPWEGLE